MDFTHVDSNGRVHMVDVSGKPVTARYARAEAFIRLSPETAEKIREGSLAKGDVLAAAKIAAVSAAKRTGELIPLCHPLPLEAVDVSFRVEEAGVRVTVEVRCTGKTGVEMEALTAAAVAALTVYDMCKAADPAMVITDIRLLEKRKESP